MVNENRAAVQKGRLDSRESVLGSAVLVGQFLVPCLRALPLDGLCIHVV